MLPSDKSREFFAGLTDKEVNAIMKAVMAQRNTRMVMDSDLNSAITKMSKFIAANKS